MLLKRKQQAKPGTYSGTNILLLVPGNKQCILHFCLTKGINGSYASFFLNDILLLVLRLNVISLLVLRLNLISLFDVVLILSMGNALGAWWWGKG